MLKASRRPNHMKKAEKGHSKPLKPIKPLKGSYIEPLKPYLERPRPYNALGPKFVTLDLHLSEGSKGAIRCHSMLCLRVIHELSMFGPCLSTVWSRFQGTIASIISEMRCPRAAWTYRGRPKFSVDGCPLEPPHRRGTALPNTMSNDMWGSKIEAEVRGIVVVIKNKPAQAKRKPK